MIKDIVWPISTERVNSHVSRLTVFMNACLMVWFLLTLEPVLVYIVALDYGIRAMGYNNLSLLCFISNMIVKTLKLDTKMIDKAPKIFASRLGFVCAALGSLFIYLNMTIAATVIIAAFSALAIMDSAFNFCVGCLIYHSLVFPFYKKKIL